MVSVITGEGRLSQLLIDTNLAMGAFNVTLSGNRIPPLSLVVGDTVRHSDDAALGWVYDVWAVRKTITFAHGIKGTLRISFSLKSSYEGTVSGKIKAGGVDVGSQQDTSGTDWSEKSQDIAIDIGAGETIELWGQELGSGGLDMKEFRIKYALRNKET